jgi:thioredoxin 1
MSVIHLTKDNFEEKIAQGVALVDFWAPWCGPCKMVGPIIDELSGDYQGKAIVAKVNVDEEAALAAEFGIMSVPTVIVFKEGREAERVMGAAGKESYKEVIEKYLK